MMKKVLLPVLFALASAAAHAQMDMDPPKELAVLNWTFGKWTGNVHWNMEGQEMDVKMDMETRYDGKFVYSESVMDMMGMKMVEKAFLSYDAATKSYKSYTFTNWAATPRIETLTVKGDVLVFLSEPWDGGDGKLTSSRATMTKVSATEAKFLLEFKDGDKWNKVGEGTFKKS